MNGGHPICAVRSDDCQIGHAYFSLGAFLDEANAPNAFLVSGETASNLIEQTPIDLVDDLQVTREHDLKPCQGPFFQGFREQCMVGVSEGLCCDVPCLYPSKMRLVQQNTHQLGDRHGRVRVVKLNRGFFGKRAPILVEAPKASNYV